MPAVEQPLADAWRLFHKQEPTYAFAAAIRVLESALRQALGHPLMLNNNRLPVLYDLLWMAAERGRISAEQRRHLDRLRVRRNQVLHGPLRLTESQARVELDYLEQIITQLCS